MTLPTPHGKLLVTHIHMPALCSKTLSKFLSNLLKHLQPCVNNYKFSLHSHHSLDLHAVAFHIICFFLKLYAHSIERVAYCVWAALYIHMVRMQINAGD